VPIKSTWLRHVVAVVWLAAACDQTHSDQQPIGGTVDTEASIQRYLRHTYLDLGGKAPTDDELATQTTRLLDAGNTPTARTALVDELIARPEFATVWVTELENGIFGGNTLEQQYDFVCGIIRGTDQACMSCSLQDSCACNCPVLQQYFTERENLRLAPVDFSDGVGSGQLERQYALAFGYFALAGAPENRVRTLFDDFLSRTAEADEVENGRSMIFGAIIPGSPAGLLFHRHGASYADLVDIVFTSEIYREAIVRRVFERYLARSPNPIELAHFTTTIDANDPDLRGVIRAVVSSREYFDQ
jgi:hypothetical protein